MSSENMNANVEGGGSSRGCRAAAVSARQSLSQQFDTVDEMEEDEPRRASTQRSQKSAKSSQQSQAGKRAKPGDDDGDDDGNVGGNNGTGPRQHPFIKKIRMDNFMCHNDKTVVLQPKINFIHGMNGTGKSAVLAAIASCLGASCKAVGRFDSLKGSVGEYRERMVLEVTISPAENKPVELGDLKIYGDILVQRSCTRAGGAALKIFEMRNGSKHQISPGRGNARPSDDLRMILEDVNIQPENPVQVMHQAQTKAFLHDGKPDMYYKFFAQATLLDVLKEELTQWKDFLDNLEDEDGKAHDSYATFKTNKFLPAEKEWKDSQELRDVAGSIKELEHHKGWVLVKEQKEKIRNAEQESALIEDKLSEYAMKENEAREDLAANNAKRDSASNEVQDKKNILNEITLRAKECKKLKDTTSTTLRKTKMAAERCKEEIEAERRAITQLKKDREDKMMEAERLRAQKQGSSKSTLRSLEEEEERITAELASIGEGIPEIEQVIQQKQSDQSGVSRSKMQLKGAVDQAKSHLKSLQGSSRSTLNLFGAGVERIANAVEQNARKFPGGKKPIGPIGKFIKIKDSERKWSKAAADTIHPGVCQTYLYEGKGSEEAMRSIVNGISMSNQEKGHYQMRLANKDKFDGIVLYPGEKTIMDIIEIDHPDPEAARIIHNFLVDNSKINEIRLVNTYEEATRNTDPSVKPKWVTLPNGVKFSASKDCYNVFPDGATRKFTCKGTISQSLFVAAKDVFTVDMGSAIREAEDKVRRLETDLSNVVTEEKHIAAEVKDMEAKKAQAAKRRQKLEAEIARVQSEKSEEEAKDSEDPALALVGVTQMIEGEIKTKEATVEKLRDSQLIKLEEDLERQKEEADKANIECKAAESELSKVQEEMSSLKQDNDGVMSRQVELTQKLSTLEKKIIARKKERDAAEAEAAECKKTLEQMLQLAIQPEIPPEEFAHGGNLKELCKELEKKRKQLADGERHQRKSTAAIMSHYMTIKAHKEARKQKLKATKEMINLIRSNLQQRHKSFKTRRIRVAGRISGEFAGFLGVKKYSGWLEFDHNERTMHPIVKTDSNKSVNLRRDEDGGTKALSGGEKSYTSLCLVMALSDGKDGAPLVAMDEFDVFMDEAARRLSLEVLSNLRSDAHSQTILVSPLGAAAITDPNVHKVEMPRIDRSQTSLRLGGDADAS